MNPIQIVFLVLAAMTLASAVMVASTRRMMHAALWLVLCLLGVAGLFGLLETRFFVVVQVVVYIGAIAILILFAVMVTRRMMDDTEAPLLKNWWASALAAVVMFGAITWVLSGWNSFNTSVRTLPAGGEDLAALGQAFVDPAAYLIPFEVASVLLVAAMIGAIYIAIERKGGKG